MTLTPKIVLSLAGLALLGIGAALWAHYGSLVYFDITAASLQGCFF